MKNKKHLLYMILACIMAFTMTGCGDKQKEVSATAEPTMEAVNENTSKLPPAELYFISQYDKDGNPNYVYEVEKEGDVTKIEYVLQKDLDTLQQDGSIILSHEQLESVELVAYNDYGVTDYRISLKFNEEGTERFAQATTQAAKKGESIAICFNGNLISVPTVNAAITDGCAQITGGGDRDELQLMVDVLNAAIRR